jgi:lipoteichoic acid synthase
VTNILKSKTYSPEYSVFIFTFLNSFYFNYQTGIQTTVYFFFNVVLFSLFLSLLIRPFSFSVRLYLSFIINILLWVLIFSDIIFYRHFASIIPIFSFFGLSQIVDIRSSILSNIQILDFLFLPLVILFSLVIYRQRIIKKVEPNLSRQNIVLLVTLTLALSGFIFSDFFSYLGIIGSYPKVYNSSESLAKSGPVLSHMRDFATSLKEVYLKGKISTEHGFELNKFFYNRMKMKDIIKRDSSFGELKGTNLIVIQIEGLQRWAVGARYEEKEIMPFLSRLRAKGTFYNSVYDQTHYSPTADSEYAFLNSLQPEEKGATPFRLINNDFKTIATTFRDFGYETYSSHAFKSSMWNRLKIHPKYGFNKSYFADFFPREPKIGWGLCDEAFLQNNFQILKTIKKPYFGFLVTLTSHHPYHYLSEKETKLDTTVLAKTHLGDYINSVNYVDRSLEVFWKNFEEIGLAEDTTVVIYGDHDSKLKIKETYLEYLEKYLELEDDIVSSLLEREVYTDKIPFLIIPAKSKRKLTKLSEVDFENKDPKHVLWALKNENRVIETVGGHIDMAPTILHLFGLDSPKSFIGLPLVFDNKIKRVVTRLDGNFISQEEIYNKGLKNCTSRKSKSKSNKFSSKQCRRLIKNGQKQLEISKIVNSENLAFELSK